jgi:hypothetical protein
MLLPVIIKGPGKGGGQVHDASGSLGQALHVSGSLAARLETRSTSLRLPRHGDEGQPELESECIIRCRVGKSRSHRDSAVRKIRLQARHVCNL